MSCYSGIAGLWPCSHRMYVLRLLCWSLGGRRGGDTYFYEFTHCGPGAPASDRALVVPSRLPSCVAERSWSGLEELYSDGCCSRWEIEA